jgi:hypothetical protein
MGTIEQFQRYAAAFEEFFRGEDPSVLEPFFTEDAVYEILGGPPFGGKYEGRDAVLDYLKRSTDGFDRRFATRQLEILEGPELRDDAVWLRWRVTYRSPGLAELTLDGEETVVFEGDRIRRLEDVFPLETSSITEAWFAAHGEELAAPAG